MSRSIAAILVSGILGLASPATSQETDSLILSLEQSISIMLENSRDLHSSQMNIEAAEAKAGEANAAALASVKLGATYTRLSDVPSFSLGAPVLSTPIVIYPSILNNYNLRLSLQQPLFAGFRYSGNAAIAGHLAGSSKEEFEREKSGLIFAVKNAYWSLYKAREVRKVVEENVQQVQEHLNDIQSLLDQGIATKNELLRVEVQLSEAQVRRINAENTMRMAQYNFNNILGLPLGTKIGLATELRHDPIAVPDVDVMVRAALECRPEVKASEFNMKAAEAGVTVARSGWYPQIFLFGNFIYARPNQRIFPARDEFKDTWDVGVSLSWDVWNWGTTIHQTTTATSRLEQARDGLAQLKDGITLEVTQAYLAVEESAQRILVAQKGVTQGEENHRITNQKFKAGLVLNSDLTDAEVALLSTKWNYIQALADYNIALARLEKATGEHQQPE